MQSKTDTEVLIGGKVFTLSGYESAEYLQKIAMYLNNKMSEYSKVESFKRLPGDTQNVLMQLNIADDYFKAQNQIASLEDNLETRAKDLYDLKHQLITAQIKMDGLEKDLKKKSSELEEATQKIIRLETEIEKLRRM